MTDKEYRLALTQVAFQAFSLELPPNPEIHYNTDITIGDVTVMVAVVTRAPKALPLLTPEALESPTAVRRIGLDKATGWPLTDKDKRIVEIVRLEPGLLSKEIAKRLKVSPRNSDMRARLANLSGRGVLVSSASRGYTLGPFAPALEEAQPA